MTEDRVEGHLFKLATALGALCIKFKPYRRGWPDRSLYWPDGVHDLAELKRPKGGRYEPLQLRTHARLRRMGHRVLVLNTKEEVDAYIRYRREQLESSRCLVFRATRRDVVQRGTVA